MMRKMFVQFMFLDWQLILLVALSFFLGAGFFSMTFDINDFISAGDRVVAQHAYADCARINIIVDAIEKDLGEKDLPKYDCNLIFMSGNGK